MKKLHAVVLTGFLFSLSAPLTASEAVSGIGIPSIEQMKSNSTPYGLDLNAVHARYYHLKSGDVPDFQNDISATVLKIRELKKDIKQNVMDKMILQKTKGILGTDPRILEKTQKIQSLNADLSPLLHKVMKAFSISIETATKIPADS
jgi:hypothetical protein